MYTLKSSKNQILIQNLNFANTFKSRMIGLLKNKNLNSNEALWIYPCNSIHTFFMKFPIDVLFIDENFIIKKIYKSLKPWRLTPIVFNYYSTIELPLGTIEKNNLTVGDKIHVCC